MKPVRNRFHFPSKNEMYIFGEYELHLIILFFNMEGAISYDINLYSHLNDEDNIGKAIKK